MTSEQELTEVVAKHVDGFLAEADENSVPVSAVQLAQRFCDTAWHDWQDGRQERAAYLGIVQIVRGQLRNRFPVQSLREDDQLPIEGLENGLQRRYSVVPLGASRGGDEVYKPWRTLTRDEMETIVAQLERKAHTISAHARSLRAAWHLQNGKAAA